MDDEKGREDSQVEDIREGGRIGWETGEGGLVDGGY